ncbi:clumping factor A-like [Patiria miniata]|uniref:DUF4806 domain-containing protein n=1 Tax=Patiria miniata TaxID=46514 RepID=A0A914AHH0_PATMI|nr:clumping factor A-like [Patiria miniata]
MDTITFFLISRMYARAVWTEGNREEEGTIPTTWMRDQTVFWPPGSNALKAFESRQEPCENWRQFPLVKLKLSADDPKTCEDYDDTTTADVSDEEVSKKRPKKRKTFGDDFETDMLQCDDHEEGGGNEIEGEVENGDSAPVCVLPFEPKKFKLQPTSPVPDDSEPGSPRLADSEPGSVSDPASPIPDSSDPGSPLSDSLVPASSLSDLSDPGSPLSDLSEPGSPLSISSDPVVKLSSAMECGSVAKSSSARKSSGNVEKMSSALKSSGIVAKSRLTVHSWNVADLSCAMKSSRNVAKSTCSSAKSSGSVAKSPGNSAKSSGSTAKSSSASAKSSGSGAKSTGSSAKSLGSMAKSTCSSAKSSGSGAKSTGSSAKSLGSMAKSICSSAKSSGSVAKSTCSSAKSSGSVAKSSCSSAKSSGSGAKSTCSSAKSSGSGAKSTCSSAKSSGSGAKSTCSSAKSSGRFQKRVLHQLVEMKEMMSQLLYQSQGSTSIGGSQESILKEPLNTRDEFMALEEKLLDAQHRASLVAYCRRIGGTDARDMVRNVVKRMMTPTLQKEFNMKGLNKQKLAFGRTALCAVIEESVVASHHTTVSAVKERIAKYLKYAYQRRESNH